MEEVMNDKKIDAREESTKQYRLRDLLFGAFKSMFGTDEIEDDRELLESAGYHELTEEPSAARMRIGMEELKVEKEEEKEKSFRERQRLSTSGGGGNSNRAGKPEISQQTKQNRSQGGR